MGLPRQGYENTPEHGAAIARTLAACVAHGKLACCNTYSLADFDEKVQQGFDCITLPLRCRSIRQLRHRPDRSPARAHRRKAELTNRQHDLSGGSCATGGASHPCESLQRTYPQITQITQIFTKT